jgi:hypothetical protein
MKKRTDIDSTSIGNEAIKSAHANTTGIPKSMQDNPPPHPYSVKSIKDGISAAKEISKQKIFEPSTNEELEKRKESFRARRGEF